ncbi:MAG: flagellar biosynthetic protein FliR [Pirellulaceae bacterium]
MSALLVLLEHQLLVFLLVLTRVSGLVMTAPVMGMQTAPVRVRGMVAVALAALVTPLAAEQVYFEHPPTSIIDLVTLAAGELVVGLSMGLGTMILFAGLQLTGQIAGQMSGMQLADIFDPGFETNVPLFARLLDLITLAVFLAIGGHREVLRALLDTFQWMPPGEARFSEGVLTMLVELSTQSFVLGIRAAAPIMVSLLLSILVLGLISRTLPQLNVLAVGFSLNTMIMLATLAISLGAIAWLFQQEAGLALETMRRSLLSQAP